MPSRSHASTGTGGETLYLCVLIFTLTHSGACGPGTADRPEETPETVLAAAHRRSEEAASLPIPSADTTSEINPPPAADPQTPQGPSSDDLPAMAELPYFQYLIEPIELAYLDDNTRPILLRPFVSNFWAGADQVAGLREWYRARVPGAVLGRYVSCIHTSPPALPTAMKIFYEEAPDHWLLRHVSGDYYYVNYGSQRRKCLDLTIPEARSALIDFWRRAAEGWDMIMVDHFVYRFSALYTDCVHGKAAIDEALLALVREHGEVSSKPLVVNVIAMPRTWEELTPYVGAFFTESALSAVYMEPAGDRLELVQAEFSAWRAALDAGRTVLLTNNNAWAQTTLDAELSQPLAVGPLLSAAVCLVRNPGEPLYYNTNVTRNHDHAMRPHHGWWSRLGGPLGPLTWDGMVATRSFERGRVELDITTAWPSVMVLIDDVLETGDH